MSTEIPTIEEERKLDQNEKEIKLEEVAELEEPIKKIIEKIKDRIENGEYGLIIGDDASGRIPALILGNFIKKISEQKDFDRPNIIFIPGKLEKDDFWSVLFKSVVASKKQHEELDDYLSKHGARKDKKILIITDTLKTGYSLLTLIELLKRAGYGCDIATIGIESPIPGQDLKTNLRGIDVFSGGYRDKTRDEDQNTPLIYKEEARKYTGVYKNPGDKISKTFKSAALPEGVYPEDVNPENIQTNIPRQQIQESINKAREDAKVVTNHLIDWYESQKQGE